MSTEEIDDEFNDEFNDVDDDIELLNDVRKLTLCMQKEPEQPEDLTGESESFDLFSTLRLYAEQINDEPASAQNVISLNQINICMLKQMENMIKRKLKELDDLYQRTSSKLVEATLTKEKKPEQLCGQLSRCGMPFFKTWGGQTHKQNQYKVFAENRGFLPVEEYYKVPMSWNRGGPRLLAIVKRYWRNKVLEQQKNKFQGILRHGPNENALLDASSKLEAAQKDDIDINEVDWWLVAGEFNHLWMTEFSPRECMLQWKYFLDPKINVRKWQMPEVKRLVAIAKENSYQNWDQVAETLGNRRTALQCCMRYMRYQAAPLRKPAIDDKIFRQLYLENSLRARPDKRLAYYFPKLSTKQLRDAINRVAPSSVGHCYQKFKALHTRKRLLMKEDEFSIEEDNFIIESLSNGLSWDRIAEQMIGKTLSSIRFRHDYLMASGKRALKVLENVKQNSPLIPEDPPNVTSILNMLWESDVIYPGSSRFGVKVGMDGITPATSFLCKHLEVASSLFGPRFPVPRTQDKKSSMAAMMSTAMQALYVDCDLNTVIDKVKSLHLDGPVETLRYLDPVPAEQLPKLKGVCLLPPNKLTLTGFRALACSRALLLGQASLPIRYQSTEMDMSIASSDRLSVEKATEKLKKRLFSLFFICSLLSKAAPVPGAYSEFLINNKRKKNRHFKRQSTLAKKQKAASLSAKRWKRDQDEAS